MNVFELVATLALNSSDFVNGLREARSGAESESNGIQKALSVVGGAVVKGLEVATKASVNFAKESVTTGMSFDASMSQVAATMGYTVDELNRDGSEASNTYNRLRDFALEMGSTTSFSASQAADALNYMALAGYTADQAIEALPSVLNLAAAGSIDLASASDMVTDAQSALGLSFEESAELVNKMAMASSKSNTSVAQLGSAILTVGGTAKTLAGGTTELSTALGILANNGIKGAEGGTALRNVILSLSAPTDKAAKLMDELGIEVFDASGNMLPLDEIFTDFNSVLSEMTQGEQTQVLNKIFNKVDLKSVNALLAGTVSGMDNISASVSAAGVEWEKYGDKAWDVNDVLNDVIESLTETGETAEELQDRLIMEYEIDADDAMKIIDTVSGQIENQSSVWDQLSENIDNATGSAENMAEVQLDNLAGDIVKFQSALEGAQIAVSDELTPTLREMVQFGTSAISTLSEAFREGGLSGAMEALGKVLNDGLALVTKKLPDVVKAGMQLLQSLIQGIIENLPLIAEVAVEIISILGTGIGESLPELVPAVVGVVLEIVNILIDNVDMLVEAGVSLITGIADGLIQAIPQLVESVPEILKGLVAALIENAPKLAEAAVQLILALAGGLSDAIPELVAVIPGIVIALVEGFIDGLPQFLEAGGQLLLGLGEGLLKALPSLLLLPVKIVQALIDKFKELFGIRSPSTVFSDMGELLMEGLVKGIENGVKAVVNFVKDIPKKIKDALNLDAALQWGKDLIGNFVDGIRSAIDWVVDGVKEVAETVKDFLGFSEPDKGPLSNFHTFAPDMMELFANGITGSDIAAKMDELAAFIRGKWQEITNDAKTAWRGIVDAVYNAWIDILADSKHQLEQLQERMVKLWDTASRQVVSGGKAVSEEFSDLVDGIREIVLSAWEDIQDSLDGVPDWFLEQFGAAKASALEPWESIGEDFAAFWENVQEPFARMQDWFEEKFTVARSAAVAAWDGITDAFDEVYWNILLAFEDARAWFYENFTYARQASVMAWDDVTNDFTAVWEKIREVFAPAVEWFGELFFSALEASLKVFENATDEFGKVWESITKAFENTENWFKETFGDAKDAALDEFAEIQDGFDEFADYLQGVLKDLEKWIGEELDGLLENIAEFNAENDENITSLSENIQSALSALEEWFAEHFDAAKENIYAGNDEISEKFQELIETIQETFEPLDQWFADKFTAIKDAIIAAFDGMDEVLQETVSTIKAEFDPLEQWFSDKFAAIAEKIYDTWDKIAEKSAAAVEKFLAPWDNIDKKFSSIWKSIENSFQLKDAKSWGTELMDNFISGIRDGIKELKEVMKEAAQEVEDGVGVAASKSGVSYDTKRTSKSYDSSSTKSKSSKKGKSDLSISGYRDFVTINNTFFSPKALNERDAAQAFKKETQKMAMSYI